MTPYQSVPQDAKPLGAGDFCSLAELALERSASEGSVGLARPVRGECEAVMTDAQPYKVQQAEHGLTIRIDP